MADQKYCRNCGGLNPPDAEFCASCGKVFVSAAASPPYAAPAAASMPWEQQPKYSSSSEPTIFGFSRKWIVIGVVALFVLLTLGCVAVARMSPSTPTPTAQATVVPTATLKATATPTVKATPKATATPTPKPTATPVPTPSGQGTASDSAFSMTAKNQGIYTEPNEFLQPDAGNKYVQIYVELTNKDSKDAMMGNQYQFKLFDNQNIGHTVALTSFGGGNSLTSLDNSNPGEKTAGVLIFEIPAGNTPTKLIWDEPGLFQGSLIVNF